MGEAFLIRGGKALGIIPGYLYSYGAEKGIWQYSGYVNGSIPANFTKGVDFIQLNTLTTSHADLCSNKELIDFTNYTKLKANIDYSNTNASAIFTLGIFNAATVTTDTHGTICNVQFKPGVVTANPTSKILEIDVSGLVSSGYVHLRVTHPGCMKIKEVWLE